MKYKTLFITFAAALSSQAAITQYTDRSSFLAALSPGYQTTDFSNLTPGDQGSTTLNVFGSVLIETRDATNSFPGNNLWVADTGNLDHTIGAATTYSDQLRISNAGFYAIGADWFLGDIDDNYLSGTVILFFSDGSTYSVTSNSQEDSFRGYISTLPLTSLLISPQDPDNVAGWVTVDNLTIPEPSSVLLGGLATLVFASRRKRSH